jgi:hypothetical protein
MSPFPDIIYKQIYMNSNGDQPKTTPSSAKMLCPTTSTQQKNKAEEADGYTRYQAMSSVVQMVS